MQIKIMIESAPPPRSKYPDTRKDQPSVEDQVREALNCIDSGKDSYVEWKMINKLYKELRNTKGPRAKNLVDMIEPVLDKYGMHGVSEKEE